MEPFALSQKLEDLAVEVHQAMEQYPKHEKYGLAKVSIHAPAWGATDKEAAK